jgi:hypothetical protein
VERLVKTAVFVCLRIYQIYNRRTDYYEILYWGTVRKLLLDWTVLKPAQQETDRHFCALVRSHRCSSRAPLHARCTHGHIL